MAAALSPAAVLSRSFALPTNAPTEPPWAHQHEMHEAVHDAVNCTIHDALAVAVQQPKAIYLPEHSVNHVPRQFNPNPHMGVPVEPAVIPHTP